ncbi:TraY domain-containing protein [Shewanella frigidimarina]|uniref:TraY domain-containing protein n=1 Tax=Shewanella frigidimarina TaxID=56812 RepID=UPI003D7AB1E3
MFNEKDSSENNSVTCTIPLDGEVNQLITESAKLSGRSKKTEAAMRLKDHVLRFKSITAVGETTERD